MKAKLLEGDILIEDDIIKEVADSISAKSADVIIIDV